MGWGGGEWGGKVGGSGNGGKCQSAAVCRLARCAYRIGSARDVEPVCRGPERAAPLVGGRRPARPFAAVSSRGARGG